MSTIVKILLFTNAASFAGLSEATQARGLPITNCLRSFVLKTNPAHSPRLKNGICFPENFFRRYNDQRITVGGLAIAPCSGARHALR